MRNVDTSARVRAIVRSNDTWKKRIEYLASLEDVWAETPGKRIPKVIIDRTIALMEAMYPDGYGDALIPGSYAQEIGVTIEWSTPKYILSLDILEDSFELFFMNFEESGDGTDEVLSTLEDVVKTVKEKLIIMLA